MSRHSWTLFIKALLAASLLLAHQPLFADQCQLNQYGQCDIPDSTFTEKLSAHINTIQHEPISHYGNPSYYKINGKRYHVLPSAAHYNQVGVASWYGKDFQGKLTANREIYDMYQYTAASKTLPIPCYVRVTNLKNGKSLIVRVNDRGPYKEGRLIDLSYAAARDLGFAIQGTTEVRVTTINSETAPQADHYLQIGSFSVYDNAEKFKSKLEELTDESVRIHQTNNKTHGTLYRVEVGPFDSHEDLSEAQQEFKDKGYQHTIAILG